MPEKKMEYGSPEYNRCLHDTLQRFAPRTYPCKKCGAPVADGWCCQYCGDSKPDVEPEKEET